MRAFIRLTTPALISAVGVLCVPAAHSKGAQKKDSVAWIRPAAASTATTASRGLRHWSSESLPRVAQTVRSWQFAQTAGAVRVAYYALPSRVAVMSPDHVRMGVARPLPLDIRVGKPAEPPKAPVVVTAEERAVPTAPLTFRRRGIADRAVEAVPLIAPARAPVTAVDLTALSQR